MHSETVVINVEGTDCTVTLNQIKPNSWMAIGQYKGRTVQIQHADSKGDARNEWDYKARSIADLEYF